MPPRDYQQATYNGRELDNRAEVLEKRIRKDLTEYLKLKGVGATFEFRLIPKTREENKP